MIPLVVALMACAGLALLGLHYDLRVGPMWPFTKGPESAPQANPNALAAYELWEDTHTAAIEQGADEPEAVMLADAKVNLARLLPPPPPPLPPADLGLNESGRGLLPRELRKMDVFKRMYRMQVETCVLCGAHETSTYMMGQPYCAACARRPQPKRPSPMIADRY